jgi:NAD(P)-dependent dehydrogenase (short-subunit alcohol dehydrogenase family)
MLVEDKVAIITGAASGIGRATAKRYAEQGASVVVADVDEAGGAETVSAITESGGEATFVSTDVSRPGEVRNLIETAVAEYGGIDVLFNNAGIEGPLAWFEDYDDGEFERVVATNLGGVFYGTKYGIEAMRADGGGSIINTSSIVSRSGIRGRSGYAGTKAGINGLTRTAAVEYADKGIRVNSVLPGIVETPMNQRSAADDSDVRDGYDLSEPMPGKTQPEEVADAVLFLGSDLASRITGIELPVDGGFLQQP